MARALSVSIHVTGIPGPVKRLDDETRERLEDAVSEILGERFLSIEIDDRPEWMYSHQVRGFSAQHLLDMGFTQSFVDAIEAERKGMALGPLPDDTDHNPGLKTLINPDNDAEVTIATRLSLHGITTARQLRYVPSIRHIFTEKDLAEFKAFSKRHGLKHPK